MHKTKGILHFEHNLQDTNLFANKLPAITHHITFYYVVITRDITITHPYRGIIHNNNTNRGQQQQQQQTLVTVNKKMPDNPSLHLI
eukprot:11789817-Ditylum_brightwellii.AAC.1